MRLTLPRHPYDSLQTSVGVFRTSEREGGEPYDGTFTVLVPVKSEDLLLSGTPPLGPTGSVDVDGTDARSDGTWKI